jgi:hypothetical protein
MKIAWLSFELCAGMVMAVASIDEVCSIKVARRRILDWIGSELNVLGKLLEEATDLLRRKRRNLLELSKRVHIVNEMQAFWVMRRCEKIL